MLLSPIVQAQKQALSFFTSSKVLPRLGPDLPELKAKEYVMAGRKIKGWYWDDRPKNLFLHLSGVDGAGLPDRFSDYLVSFNLGTATAKWQLETASDFVFLKEGNLAGLQTPNKTSFLELGFGKKLWTTRKVFLGFGPMAKEIYTASSYKIENQNCTVYKNAAEEGDELGKFPLIYNSENTYTYSISDSMRVIASNGFYGIKVGSGLVWQMGDYVDELKAAEDLRRQMAKNKGLLGVAIAYRNMPEDQNIYGNRNSAATSEKGRHYFLNREVLFCADGAGKIIWSVDAPNGMRGDCGMKTSDDYLFWYSMFRPKQGYDLPTAKLYAIDKKTGSTRADVVIDCEGSAIHDFKISKENAFALAQNTLIKFETLKYSNSVQIKIDLPKKVTLDKFVTADYFYEGSQLIKRMESDSSRVFFTSTANDVYAANTNLSSFETIDKSKVLKQVGMYKDWKVLQGPEKVVIIDSSGKPVAGFACAGKCAVQGSVLLFNGPSSLLEVDLEQLAGQ